MRRQERPWMNEFSLPCAIFDPCYQEPRQRKLRTKRQSSLETRRLSPLVKDRDDGETEERVHRFVTFDLIPSYVHFLRTFPTRICEQPRLPAVEHSPSSPTITKHPSDGLSLIISKNDTEDSTFNCKKILNCTDNRRNLIRIDAEAKDNWKIADFYPCVENILNIHNIQRYRKYPNLSVTQFHLGFTSVR